MRQELRDAGGAALRGIYRDIAVAQPAAGKDWTFTLPGGYVYRWVIGWAQLQTSATAGERFTGFQILDGDSNVRYETHAVGPILVGVTGAVGYGVGGSQPGAGPAEATSVEIPYVLLPAGWTIKSRTFNLAVGDQYSKVMLLLEQLYDEAPGQAAGRLHHDHHQEHEHYSPPPPIA